MLGHEFDYSMVNISRYHGWKKLCDQKLARIFEALKLTWEANKDPRHNGANIKRAAVNYPTPHLNCKLLVSATRLHQRVIAYL